MRLLVVEDEQSLREDITKKLQHSGYEVDACGDGETASEYLAVEYYDLVLLDLNLPKIDGMTLLRNFRKENQETPVLILSARSEINDKVEGWMQVQMIIFPSHFILPNWKPEFAVLHVDSLFSGMSVCNAEKLHMIPKAGLQQ